MAKKTTKKKSSKVSSRRRGLLFSGASAKPAPVEKPKKKEE